jgi:hypothetical protein
VIGDTAGEKKSVARRSTGLDYSSFLPGRVHYYKHSHPRPGASKWRSLARLPPVEPAPGLLLLYGPLLGRYAGTGGPRWRGSTVSLTGVRHEGSLR